MATRSMPQPEKIGILGGAGPLASASFHQRLLKAAQHKFSAVLDHQYPEIVHISRAYPGLTELGLADARAAEQALLDSAQDLQALGCTCLAIPCNSLHSLLPALRRQLSIPVLDAVAATCHAVSNLSAVQAGARVLVLSSRSTARERLYVQGLARYGISTVATAAFVQSEVDTLIHQAMAGADTSELREQLVALIARVGGERAGATPVVLGCTELSLLAPLSLCQPVVDSLDALVHQIFEMERHESL